jgi:large subunit ribosomal protein L25
MAKPVELTAMARDRAGKGAARAVRREGRIPAVIYGDKKDPQLITLAYRDTWKHVQNGRFLSTLVDVNVDGDRVRAIPRDIQFDPVRDFLMHVDFLRLGKGARIAVNVACNFINDEESPGITRGGVLNVVRHEIEVFCPADAIPEGFDIDLTGLDIGDGVHISAITMPEGIEPTISDRDFTICTIAAPAGLLSEEEEEEGEEVEADEVPTIGEEEAAQAEGEGGEE